MCVSFIMIADEFPHLRHGRKALHAGLRLACKGLRLFKDVQNILINVVEGAGRPWTPFDFGRAGWIDLHGPGVIVMDAVDAAIDAIRLIPAFNEGGFFDDEVLLLQASVIAQRIDVVGNVVGDPVQEYHSVVEPDGQILTSVIFQRRNDVALLPAIDGIDPVAAPEDGVASDVHVPHARSHPFCVREESLQHPYVLFGKTVIGGSMHDAAHITFPVVALDGLAVGEID